MKRLIFLSILLILVFAACKKDELPNEFSVLGRWKENIADSNKTEIEFRKYSVLLLKLKSDTTRNYNYAIEKVDELQIFEPAEFPDGKRSYHKISYNSRKKEMSIYSLYPAVNGEPSVTVFIRK
ncbi:MAG: hypothetical protein ACM3PX_03010 [Omnitrophica WOR_2 bacterium]|jgi:hypothetical protein